ncbi:MAG: right-handed parallel beta-helix repeat-containing protein, partial [Terriglobales bacterium]
MGRCIRGPLVRGMLIVGMVAAALFAWSPMAHVAAATLMVAPSGTDVGNCTAVACKHLTYALSAASDGDTIIVAAGTYGEPNLIVNKSVWISGAGSGTTTVDAGYLSRVFSVSSGKTVTISGFTITRGYPGKGNSGGAILNQGTLTLTNDIVNASYVNTYFVDTPRAETLVYGGGIYNDTNATLTLNGTTVTGNTAGMPPAIDPTDPPNGGGGGGIYTQGTLTIGGSTISANAAMTQVGSGDGGGIEINNDHAPVTVTITNSTITANRADSYGIGIFGSSHLYGGSLILDHVTVSNHTTSPSGYPGVNPAIQGLYSLYSMGLTMSNTTIVGNAGGGMQWFTGDCFTISDSTISNNTGPVFGGLQIGSGGCTNAITRTVISGNQAQAGSGGPGGVDLTAGTIAMTDSQITGNTGSDGGMHAQGNVTINTTTISNNVSNVSGPGGGAGGIEFYSNSNAHT